MREAEEDILVGNEIYNHDIIDDDTHCLKLIIMCDVMMICKITEDDHTNDHHHYLRYIVTVIFYNVHLISRAALEAQQRQLRVPIFSFEYFQRSPTRSMARDDILEPDKQTKNKLNH